MIFLTVLIGSRLEFNDTESYIYNFLRLEQNSNFKNVFIISELGDNPLFYNLQLFFKKYISVDPYLFIFLNASIISFSFMQFFRKASVSISSSFLIFSCFGLLLLSMAAMKQVLAMAVGIWFFYDYCVNNRLKYLWALILAIFIHPFISFYLVFLFIGDNIWSRRKLILFLFLLISGPIISGSISNILEVLSLISVNYNMDYIEGTKGGSFVRLSVYAVTPILFYIYRDYINQYSSKLVIVSGNCSIISFLFFYYGTFQAANMFSRLSSYFDIVSIIGLVWILHKAPMSTFTRTIAFISMYILYPLFLYYELVLKRGFTYISHLNYIFT
ncbi:hypothetical protein PES01_38750 [Pseudoalteromonas espejiana]|uniref:EpsG family protein n=2 Tax=Pseudoalteromonas espejiana TaxID=28107 RepID=A0A510Y159_9GAMM|nr:hypothetical protein PES01_38750 [Pseudoalteromonas espejiana]